MNRSKNFKALARALGVMATVVIVAGGVTFAALQSQQDTLTGNTIQTATANLQLSTDGANYGDSLPGFNFSDLIPGGPAVPTAGYSIYLKNSGGTALALKLAVSSVPANPDNVDLSKVNVLLTTVGSTAGAQSFSLSSLMAAGASGGLEITGGNLGSGTVQQYKLQVSMAGDAFSGGSATLSNIDLAFSGLAQAN